MNSGWQVTDYFKELLVNGALHEGGYKCRMDFGCGSENFTLLVKVFKRSVHFKSVDVVHTVSEDTHITRISIYLKKREIIYFPCDYKITKSHSITVHPYRYTYATLKD